MDRPPFHADYSLPPIERNLDARRQGHKKIVIRPDDIPPEVRRPPSLEETVASLSLSLGPDDIQKARLTGKLLGPHGVTPGMPIPITVRPQPRPASTADAPDLSAGTRRATPPRTDIKDAGVSLTEDLAQKPPARIAREPQDRPVPGNDNGPPILIPVKGPPVVTPRTDQKIFDHPVIGGKFTICVLCYGRYTQLHYECLETLLATTPGERVDIRVAANEPHPQSKRYLESLVAKGAISKYYHHAENILKYPAMREMFYDTKWPIRTNYVIWLDDDTICNRNPGWLWALATTIVDQHSNSDAVRMFGPKFFARLSPTQARWIRKAPWYRGRPFLDQSGTESAAGEYMCYVESGFFALHVETMRKCNMPDPRFKQSDGKILLGAQLMQGGFQMGTFDSRAKHHINWSSYRTRGVSQVMQEAN